MDGRRPEFRCLQDSRTLAAVRGAAHCSAGNSFATRSHALGPCRSRGPSRWRRGGLRPVQPDGVNSLGSPPEARRSDRARGPHASPARERRLNVRPKRDGDRRRRWHGWADRLRRNRARTKPQPTGTLSEASGSARSSEAGGLLAYASVCRNQCQAGRPPRARVPGRGAPSEPSPYLRQNQGVTVTRSV